MLGQVERCVVAGVPVASVAWNGGELSGTPIAESPGTLWVIRGFDPLRNAIERLGCDSSQVRRGVYRPGEFARAWFCSSSGGVV